MKESSKNLFDQSNALISEEIHEVISYRPHWIVRKGNTLFFVILLLLLGLTWLIRYPDKIITPSRLVAVNPPKLVVAKITGKIDEIFVTNEQWVKKDQPIAHLESIANFKEVKLLGKWLDSSLIAIQANHYDFLITHPFPELTQLGEIQTSCEQFKKELAFTKQTLTNGYYQRKKGALQKDLQYLAKLRSNAVDQKELEIQDQSLDKKEYDVYEKLAKEKVIAPLELNQYKSKLIVREQHLKQMNAQLTNADISSHEKRKEILDLDKQITDQHQQFYSSVLNLKSEVEKWMQQYILTAPEEGKLLFTFNLQENESVSSGQGLFYVQPVKTHYYCEAMAGQERFGKLKTGQKVLLKVSSYPDQEFGYLAGTVNYISSITNRNDSFLVKINLDNGLVTNFNKTIFFRNGLNANAEIITANRRLIDRLLGQLKDLIK